ncbi:hypothetical protein TWF694_006879 [Orbilia ellipsospora]|uniref:M protein, serotype 2.1 n=1 Tax=Orbilia ellipsospora TaxID=2528407 RepID=A0AAV9XLW0_9PEZI
MATANVKKLPPTPTTTSSPARSSYKSPASTSRSTPTTAARSNTPSKDRDTDKTGATSTKAREGSPLTSPKSGTNSPFSAKAVARRSTQISTPPADMTESQLENAAEIGQLRQKLTEAESKALALEDDFSKQKKTLQARMQARMDEALSEQSKLEELLAGRTDAVETLENELKELQRAKRDQEKLFEAERAALMTEKEEMMEKEEAQGQIISRLKQALKEKPSSDVPDTADSKSEQDVPVVSPRTDGHKDKVIESLRAELAEAQVRFTEALKLEERKQQDAADQLSELRKNNAKLQDENESFQLLLGQATMNGEIRNGFLGQWAEDSASSSPSKETAPSLSSTLAEEIESASQKEENDELRKLKQENKEMKDQNKAMTLYINTMIERLLNSNQESVLDRTPGSDKALPPVPQETSPAVTSPQSAGLGRSKSLLNKRPPIRASMPPPPRKQLEEEDEVISPIQRSQTMHVGAMPSGGHRRTRSDVASPTSPNANYMYQAGSPPSKQTTFYTGPRFGAGPLSPTKGASSSNSSDNGESINSKDHHDANHHTLSGKMEGKTLRPLRLVDGAPPPSKTASPQTPRNVSGNRNSWMPGWFSKQPTPTEATIAEAPKLTPTASTSSVE